ncbi:MAG: MYXO-CTERM domain-containing protein [Polyangiales bacterium]|jgi:MYXO-CTERM domain-containing protein
MSRLSILAVLCLGFVAPAQAYTIGTGFTEGCHERITALAFDEILGLLQAPVQLPEEDDWKRVGGFAVRSAGIDRASLTETEFFILHSLLAGVRSPDTDGHSVLNLDRARALHTDPAPIGQYAHALRASEDDYEEGNRAAVDGMREVIARELSDAVATTDNEEIEVFFDFYGTVDVVVWSPAYHIGRAAHAVQDSFSHTIRDEGDDFHSIISVLNFSEAVANSLVEERDGIAHSSVLDSCGPETDPVVRAAQEATRLLFIAASEMRTSGDMNGVELFLDDWYLQREGCNEENGFCGNAHWVRLARDNPTEPFLCSTDGTQTSTGPGWILFALALAGWRRRS